MKNEDFRASLRAARAGFRHAWRTGRNLRFQWAAAYAALLLGAWLRLPAPEMALLVLVAALVIVAEMINSAIEVAVDLASESFHPLARTAKDVAAGAVLVAAAVSIAVGALLLLPRLPDLPGVLADRLAQPATTLLGVLPLVALLWAWLGGARGSGPRRGRPEGRPLPGGRSAGGRRARARG